MTPTANSPLRPTVRALLLVTAFLLPLLVSLWTWDRTEVPRMTLLRGVTLLGYLLWVCQPNFRMPTVRTSRLLLPLVLAAGLSAAYSIHQGQSIVELLGLLTYVAYFYLVYAAARDLRFTTQLTAVLVASAFIMAVYGVGQHWGFDPLHWRVPREALIQVFSTFGNRIYMAGYLAMLMPLALAWAVVEDRRSRRTFALLTYELMALCLLFSAGRAGLGAALGALLLLTALCRYRPVPGARRTCVLGLVLLGASWAATQTLDHYAGKQTMAARLGALGPGHESVSDRWELARAAVRAVGSDSTSSALGSPAERLPRALLGWGPGTFDLLAPWFTEDDLIGSSSPTAGVPALNPHGDLLLVAAAQGLAGLFLWLRLLVGTAVSSWQAFRRGTAARSDGSPQAAAEGMLLAAWMACGTGYVLQSLVTPRVVGTQFLFWTCLAVLASGAARRLPGFAEDPPQAEAACSSVPVWGRRLLAGGLVLLLLLPANLPQLPEALAQRRLDTRLAPSLIAPLLADYHLRRALDLRDAGRFEEAFRHHQAAVAHEPGRRVLWLSLGDTCRRAAEAEFPHSKGWLVAAQRAYQYLIRSTPKDGLAHKGLADTLFLADRLTEAARRESLGSAGPWLGVRQRASASSPWLRGAEAEYRKTLQLWPRIATGHYGLAKALQAQGRFSEAEEEYLTAIELGSGWGEPEAYLGWLYWRRGLRRSAIACMELALKRAPGRNPYFRRYQQYLRQMRAEAAQVSEPAAPRSSPQKAEG